MRQAFFKTLEELARTDRDREDYARKMADAQNDTSAELQKQLDQQFDPIFDATRRALEERKAQAERKRKLAEWQASYRANYWEGWHAALTARERDILRLIAAGLSTREIAEQLYLSINTVKTHTRGLYGKLGVSSRLELALFAINHQLVEKP